MSYLKFDNVDFGYSPKEKILKGISFHLEQGSSMAIVGESGSGKTTLGKLIIGELKGYKGEISYCGKEVEKHLRKDHLNFTKKVQMVYQDSTEAFNPQVKIHQILSEPFLIHKEKVDPSTLISLLKEVFLPSYFLNCYPHQLSGGQKQRLSIARALSLSPSLMVLDEPTSSLDTITKMQILSLLQKIKDRLNTTYLLITHDIHIARLMADYILVLKDGKIVELGETEDIFNNSNKDYTKELLSAANYL